MVRFWLGMLGVLCGCAMGMADDEGTAETRNIGSQRELFLDDYLIGSMTNTQILVHTPVREEIAIQTEQPWEGNGFNYFTVLYDPVQKRYQMYCHAWGLDNGIQKGKPLFIAYYQSQDGIHWERPNLGFCEFNGSKENNILLDRMANGAECHDFSPFLDTNPNAPPEARYKATGASIRTNEGIWVYQSPDGIHWKPMFDQPVFQEGAFDSQNVAFWSPSEKQYVLYYRVFSDGNWNGFRQVRRAVSPDLKNWKVDGTLQFPNGGGPRPEAQYYVNQILPYYRAPQIYLGFPARYCDNGRTESTSQLPEWDLREKRIQVMQRLGTACTDSVYITSRDGMRFQESNDVFLAPGLRTRDNWSYGDNYIARHVVETDSLHGDAPRELSLYATESYMTGDDSRLRRYTLRLDGFGSVHAKRSLGEMRTKPLTFTGKTLSLNVATSAAGKVRVEILDADSGAPIPGWTLDECDVIYGDYLDYRVRWKGQTSVEPLAGRRILLRFVMEEADLYSLQFE